MNRARLAVALPALFICTLPGGGGQGVSSPAATANATIPFVSIGGGPPGGVRVAGRATPTDYGDCGPGGLRETGLQGQVPAADQASGASKQGARCNLRLVGENDIRNRGANFQMGWYGDCAYVGSVGAREIQSSGDDLDGVAVIDVADPKNPKLATIVRAPSGISQHEAVEVNEERGMLVVETGGLVAQYVDVYDVSKDCRNPVFKGRYDAGKPLFHGMVVSDDGRTVYATDFTGYANATQEVMHVIDVTDMSNPTLLTKWDPTMETPAEPYGIHDLEISADGNRAYLGAVSPSAAIGALGAGPPSNAGGPSMVVLDTSDIQARRPNPDPEVISSVSLPNFGHTEQRATIGGKPFMITSGETPFRGADNCPWAWGNLVDISDERNPKVVSELKLEVNEQDNCDAVGPDNAVYSIHYVGVDDELDTSLVFYSYYTGGVRIFDVRDPKNPKEIGYFHPAPVASTVHPPTPLQAGDFQGPEWDSATSDIRYLPEERQLWYVSIGRGFQVLELTGRAAEAVASDARAKVRIPRQKAAKVLRKEKLKVRARCTDECELGLKLKLGGRKAGERTVELGAGERKRARIKVARKVRRGLVGEGAFRAKVTGKVRDPATGDVIGKVKAKPRTLR